MKTQSLLVLLVLPVSAIAGSACDAVEQCPYGESLVRDAYDDSYVCVPKRYDTGGSASGSSSAKTPSSAPTQAAAPAAAPTSATTATPAASAPDPAATCGGVDALSDSIRVVDKSDLAPTLSDTPPNVADGTYQLVQASFYRNEQSTTPVRNLKATIAVKGAAISLGVKDTTLTGQPNEGLTFLLGQNLVTKTCESSKGAVSAWFFPFSVGATGEARLSYDGPTGILRLVVKRTDGSTELVFSR